MDSVTGSIYPKLKDNKRVELGFEKCVNDNDDQSCQLEDSIEETLQNPSQESPKPAGYPTREAPKLNNSQNNSYSSNSHDGSMNFNSESKAVVEESDSNHCFKYLFIFISPVVLLISYFLFHKVYPQEKSKIEFKPLESKIFYKNLTHDFKNQQLSFHTNIISCYEQSILSKKDPSIIMLVSDKNSKQNLDCVAKKVLKVLNEAIHGTSEYKNLVISTRSLDKDSDKAKFQLDSKLTNLFSHLNKRVALVEDISNIPPKSMMLFYAYGDEYSNSRYNGIVVLLTYTLDIGLSKDKFRLLANDYSLLSSLVEDKLTAEWSNEIHYDQLRPLFSRITNNIVLVDKENNC